MLSEVGHESELKQRFYHYEWALFYDIQCVVHYPLHAQFLYIDYILKNLTMNTLLKKRDLIVVLK